MINLFAQRIFPLFLRPAAILLEGTLIADGDALVFVIPASMMALTISSIPVHLTYFRSYKGQEGFELVARRYAAALSWLTVLSLLILAASLFFLTSEISLVLIGAVLATFVVEKLSTETSRALEFQKAFTGWFWVQCIRSGWFFLAIATALLGFNYEWAILCFSAVFCLAMYFIFVRVTDLVINFDLTGLVTIPKNIIFLLGGFLPASYLQVPRLLVTKFFPEQAHIFLAVSQICQGVGVLFNLRYQIPYRKISARKTKIFQRLMWPTMRSVLLLTLAFSMTYLLSVVSGALTVPKDDYVLALVLGPIFVADTLLLAILSAHLNYVHWISSKVSAFVTYLICVGFALAAVALLAAISALQGMPLLLLPVLSISIGTVWIYILRIRLFHPANAPPRAKMKGARSEGPYSPPHCRGKN